MSTNPEKILVLQIAEIIDTPNWFLHGQTFIKKTWFEGEKIISGHSAKIVTVNSKVEIVEYLHPIHTQIMFHTNCSPEN